MGILVFRNQELETDLGVRDLSAITDGLIHGIVPIPDADIREINVTPNYLYAANNLICLLDNGSPTRDQFGTPEIRVNGFWKMSDFSADGSEFPKYQRFETSVEVQLFTPGRISIKIRESDKEDVEEAYRARGLTKPDYGMLLVVLNFTRDGGQRREFAYLLKYTHHPLFSAPISIPGASAFPTQNVYKSPPYSSETFFVPEISSSFVYNFFEPQEADYDVYVSRDYKGKNVSDIPKYIKLTWDKPSFDQARFDRENNPPAFKLPVFTGSFLSGGLFNPGSFFSTGSNAFTGTILTSSYINRSEFIFGSEPTKPAAGVVRIGGLIVSNTAVTEEIARHMADAASRTGIAAAGAFDGANTPVTPAGTAGSIEVSEEAQADILDSVVNGPTGGGTVVDSFQTYIPRALDINLSLGLSSDYVGYVIEKARLTEDGQFSIVDIIAISGKNTTEFLDWKIAYGESYRYRIRTVFRFVNKHNLSMFADTDSAINREQSVKYVDSNTLIQPQKTFYFDSVYSDSTEIQVIESVRPNVPSNVRIFSNSKKREIFITWNQKNQNRDVVGFNVYRKTLREVNLPFVRLNNELIGIRENKFFDYDIEPDIDYIYAVEAVDFHGNFSSLSAQYYARIKEFVVDQQIHENSQKFFDVEGREIGESVENEESDLILCRKNFALNVNPLFQNTDENNTFVIKVTSLDTGHSKEIKINFRTLTIYHAGGYVPAPRQQYLPFPGALGFFDAETLAKLIREFGNRT
jgi:hypothetical protein